MCQSMPICTLNIFYDPSVYDNVDGLDWGMFFVSQCFCLSLENEATIEVETQSLLQVMTVHPKMFWSLIVYLRGHKQVCSETKHNKGSKQWVKNLWVFFLLRLSGKFLVSWRWALKFNEVGVDYVEHFLLLWLFSQWYDSYQVEILT